MPVIEAKSKLPTVSAPSLKNLTVKDFGRLEKDQTESLQSLVRPHVDSFNWFINSGLRQAAKHIPPIQCFVNKKRFSLRFVDASLDKPRIDDSARSCRVSAIYPSECRQRGGTYSGKLHATVSFSIDDVKQASIPVYMGLIPVMVKSERCNLHGMSPAQLVAKQEEAEEMGGYFIVNGNEKLLRLLVAQRRNFPIGIVRPSWKDRGPNFTEYGVSVRSVASDQTATNMVMHYLKNGTVVLCIFHRKEYFMIPLIVMLKCLVDIPDVEIYTELIKTKEDDTFFKSCVQNMLRQAHAYDLHLHADFLRFVGEKFRIKLNQPTWTTDAGIAKFLLKHNVLIHLDSNEDKFQMLCLMTRKVFDLAMNQCLPDNLDSVQFQEVLLPGHLYVMILKEKMVLWLLTLSRVIQRHYEKNPDTSNLARFSISPGAFHTLLKTVPDIGKAMSYLLATGNVNSKSGLGLQQTTGLSIVADKLNFMRYLSHFRSIHRGAYFAEMQTTEVRKLLPESWGFLCPVHTPDGAPCGLKNHMSFLCEVVTQRIPNLAVIPTLYEHGMLSPDSRQVQGDEYYPVILNGNLIGWYSDDLVHMVEKVLRRKKCNAEDNIPSLLEICLIKRKADNLSQYPALYLFTDMARMVRPVMNLKTGNVEMIGTFEQVYMDICIIPEEKNEETTHQELAQNSILSAVASITPFSDFNQSPRNMYQCQMGKQTMGTPCQNFHYRSDNKLYRIQTPQSPMVRPLMYDHYKMDNFPFGTNAVVAVISYTGFDMEDAMILNKGSFDRGFAHGCIYQTHLIDLSTHASDSTFKLTFGILRSDSKAEEAFLKGQLQEDGLPAIGQRLEDGDPFYAYINHSISTCQVKKYTSQEAGIVDNIKVLSNSMGSGPFNRISIVLRIQRNPIIGDKFASRHGQKGICSQMWPIESIPFTESGLYPDIIFNPHGFPSRMTIGMMIESMAGKAAALHGEAYDATPFTFSENHSAIDHFGLTLRKAGFNYYGTEKMYSGVSGLELEAEIFIGVVYYQRLRHMVSDKFQVRSTGPIDPMTHQPVKGRKRAGGMRFGEMERDALLAHGCAYILYDRLLMCSDVTQAHVCDKCNCLISPLLEKGPGDDSGNVGGRKWKCGQCGSKDSITVVTMPSVYRYLANELAAANIKSVLKTR